MFHNLLIDIPATTVACRRALSKLQKSLELCLSLLIIQSNKALWKLPEMYAKSVGKLWA